MEYIYINPFGPPISVNNSYMVIKTDRALKHSQDTTANWSTLYGAVGAERVDKTLNSSCIISNKMN